VADDADEFAALDLEIDVAQRPKLLDLVRRHDRPAAQHVEAPARDVAGATDKSLAQNRTVFDLVADDELLAEPLCADGDIGHA
jgi:hypothetical protein